MPNLYLFDIDGTLVDLTNVHAQAYLEAYEKVLDFKSKEITRQEIISTFGMMERDQHLQIFQKHKLEDAGRINKIIKIYEKLFIKNLKSTNIKPLPGVIEFLDYLKNHNQYLGIVSSNPEYKGEVILKKAGLYNYFLLFGYDEGFNNRAEIIRAIIKKSKEKNYQFEKTIVIGDTISDIQAGKEAGAITVGVASGTQSRQLLESKKSDIIVDNLIEYPEILKVVNKKRR